MSFEMPAGVMAQGGINGMTYGLLAVGLVLVYRTSRVVNFAQGSVGTFAAAVLVVLVDHNHLPYWLVFPLAAIIGAGSNMAVELVAVRRLRNVPTTMSIVATLGVGAFLISIASAVDQLLDPGSLFPQPPHIAQFTIGVLLVTPAYTAQLIATPVIVIALALFLRYSRFGIATRAAATNREAAMLTGISPGKVSSVAWGIAGAISAYAAVMQSPQQGVGTDTALDLNLLVRALLLAVLARMSSMTVALVAGVVLGLVEQLLLWNTNSANWMDVVLFVAMFGAVLFQSRGSARTSEQVSWSAVQTVLADPPAVARLWAVRNLGRLTAATLLGALLLVGLWRNSDDLVLIAMLGYTLVGISVYVITGLTGQLSLGQFAIAGVGGALSYQLTLRGVDFSLSVLIAALGCGIVAVLVGCTALRVRGLFLAVSTLTFALMCENWLLNQSWMFGQGYGEGVNPGRPILFGSPLLTSRDYYYYCIPFFLIGTWLAWNVARGGLRRTLLAVRDNEDGARAFGIKPTLRKLQAFGVAGVLAGLGGAIYAHSLFQVDGISFPATDSITVVAIAIIGGLQLLSGSLLGAAYLVALPALVTLGPVETATSTLGWLILIVYFPGGLAQLFAPLRRWAVALIVRLHGLDPVGSDAQPAEPEQFAVRSELLLRSDTALDRRPSNHRDAPATLALEVRDVRRRFGGVTAVDGISLDVADREIVGLIGPNGAGKTTLFEIIGGFTRPDGGQVLFHGQDITRYSPERRCQMGLVRSFQDARLFPTMSVLDVARLAQERDRPTRFTSAATGLRAAGRLERAKSEQARDLLSAMGLTDYMHTPIGALSTGTRRMTELACIIAMQPSLVLLDEPSSGIAQRETEALASLIGHLRDRFEVTIVLIEHDIPMLSRICDRIVAIEAGSVIATGPADAVCADARVVSSYLGTDATSVARSGAALAT